MRAQGWTRLSLLAVLTALFTNGCGQSATNSAQGTVATAPAPVESTGTPISDDDAKAFGESMEAAVNKGKPDPIAALIDWDALLDTTMAGVNASEKARTGFRTGAKSSLKQPSSLVGSLAAATKQGGTFRLLRTRTVDKRRTALCRLIMPDSGVSYFDFILARRPDGQVRAVDIYVFISGERLSQTLRRLYIPAAASDSRTLIDRLAGQEQEFIKNFPAFEKFTTEVREGKAKEALATYRQFPAGLQKDKSIMLMRLRAAQKVGEKEYEAFIEDFRRFHPQDASIDFLSIDHYIYKKNFGEALGCIDRLDKALGGDPYANVLRGSVYMESGDFDKADKAFLDAIKEEPELRDAYWNRVVLSLKRNDFITTVAVLTQIRDRFQQSFDPKNETFGDFVNSPEYRAMIRTEEKTPQNDRGTEAQPSAKPK